MTHLNLLPTRFQRGQLIRRRLRQWVVVAAVVFLATGIQIWSSWTKNQTVALQVDALRRQYHPVEEMQREIDDIQTRIDGLHDQERLGLELADQKSIVTLLGYVSRSARRADGKICVSMLDVKRQRDTVGDVTKISHALTVDGVGLSEADISHFSASLHDVPALRGLVLHSFTDTSVGGVKGLTYKMECTY